MEEIDGRWIMKGCSRSSPDRIRTAEELAELIVQIGFLPLFSNRIPGFSVEERTPAETWWTGRPDTDPWEWRQTLSRDPRVAYGKFFDRKAGFLSRDCFPAFANYRRNGYDFDALNDEGLAPYRQKKIMDCFAPDGRMLGRQLLSCELKTAAGFGKNGEKNFEGVVTDLQMQTYLIVGGFRRRRNRRGEEYGWHLAVLETPETKWGCDLVAADYAEDPARSWETLEERLLRAFPDAREKDVRQLLGVRHPGER